MNTKLLCRAGVLAAVTFAVTRFLQVPIPLGYFNVGNTAILLSSLFLPPFYAAFVGGVGSALADLTSYPVYTLPTLLIKGLMPILFLWIAARGRGKRWSMILGAALSTLLPLLGYTVTGMLLYGGFAAGLAQFPGLLLEYAANLALFILLSPLAERIRDRLR